MQRDVGFAASAMEHQRRLGALELHLLDRHRSSNSRHLQRPQLDLRRKDYQGMFVQALAGDVIVQASEEDRQLVRGNRRLAGMWN